jgi:uroporphyrin-III C-methyltransferase
MSEAAGPGHVYLVGAGPGAPDLITLRGLRLLQRADVVIHDRLIPHELLAEAPESAEIIDVGKRPGAEAALQELINELLVARAKAGGLVVRLKGGDPAVFGRAAEEMAACRAAGVACTMVPGVTSALAAAAALGISLTERGAARSVAFCTARSADAAGVDVDALTRAAPADTLVVLMGGAALPEVMDALQRAGVPAATPAACVASAMLPNQSSIVATAGTLAACAERLQLKAPLVTIVGEVVRCARSALPTTE